jgi:hypothetical protein
MDEDFKQFVMWLGARALADFTFVLVEGPDLMMTGGWPPELKP